MLPSQSQITSCVLPTCYRIESPRRRPGTFTSTRWQRITQGMPSEHSEVSEELRVSPRWCNHRLEPEFKRITCASRNAIPCVPQATRSPSQLARPISRSSLPGNRTDPGLREDRKAVRHVPSHTSERTRQRVDAVQSPRWTVPNCSKGRVRVRYSNRQEGRGLEQSRRSKSQVHREVG